jgi:hypothetical protein
VEVGGETTTGFEKGSEGAAGTTSGGISATGFESPVTTGFEGTLGKTFGEISATESEPSAIDNWEVDWEVELCRRRAISHL